jgi:hypothetical protein
MFWRPGAGSEYFKWEAIRDRTIGIFNLARTLFMP